MTATAWLASYPKSGNTWLRALLNALELDSDPEINALDVGRGHDGLDPWLGISLSNLDESEAISIQRRSWASGAPEEPGFHRRKTHQAWVPAADGFPIRWQPDGARAIYLVRDPRAVAVSWAHHNGISHRESVDSLAGRGEIGSSAWFTHDPHADRNPGQWTQHVVSWRDQTDLPVLFLTYEQLSANTVEALHEISDWLMMDADEAACARAVERCTFTRLAAREVSEGFIEAAAADRVFFRRGQIDSWRDELSSDLVAQIEKDHGSLMRELGYLN